MLNPKDSYPVPRVPEHLTKLTIENIPFDEPFFILPGEQDDFTPPAIFVGPKRELRMSRTHAIGVYAICPSNPIGLIGIMKTFVADPITGMVSEKHIADLRYIGNSPLVDTDGALGDISDQEEYMAMVAELEDSIVFDGFVAPDADDKSDGIIPVGSFYGDESLHDSLIELCSHGDKLMEAFYKREKKSSAQKTKVKKAKQKTS